MMTEDARIADLKAALATADARYDGLRLMYETLAERYHELAVRPPVVAPAFQPPTLTGVTGVTGTVAVVEEPDVPPSAVLAAMTRISPTKDKTYEANWRYWEAHKALAAAHPDAFADDIMAGAVP